MYAKIDTAVDGASLYDVGEECTFGVEVFYEPNTDDGWTDKLAGGHNVVHVVGSLHDVPPTGTNEGSYWIVHWVSWYTKTTHIAVTIWPIYILNGAGKTIDRVG